MAPSPVRDRHARPDVHTATERLSLLQCWLRAPVQRAERQSRWLERAGEHAGELCPKGVAAFEVVDNDERPTRPLVRENGRLVTASWSEALGRVEDELGRIVADHGADAYLVAGANPAEQHPIVFGRISRPTIWC